MKKISTLGFSILISVASFANYAPSRLTVSAESNTTIKVTVDGGRFDQQSFGNSVVFDNLQPGFHSVKVYQLSDRRFGFGRRGDDYRLVYNGSVNVKPLFATSIELGRFGNVQINEQPLRGYDNRRWENDDRRRNDRDYSNDNHYGQDNNYGNNSGYDDNSGYSRAISNVDFFAAERVLQHENFDDARLLYAKQVIDDNCVTAEQVKELARFFSFDNNRFEFVKYAYSKTADKSNFSVVCSAFSSTNGRDQVMVFLRGCR